MALKATPVEIDVSYDDDHIEVTISVDPNGSEVIRKGEPTHIQISFDSMLRDFLDRHMWEDEDGEFWYDPEAKVILQSLVGIANHRLGNAAKRSKARHP
jgi:hypothetical protein